MDSKEIDHLASLARIKLTDAERTEFAAELPAIMEYVSTVSDIAADTTDTGPAVGPVYNVLRADEITVEPNQCTDAILHEMPDTDGRYMKVPKILNPDS